MSWMQSLWNPFKKKEAEAPAGTLTEDEKKKVQEASGALPKELAEAPQAKGLMAQFYRKWKDPAFLKQLRTLAAYMQRDGVNVKDVSAVKAWLEKNKEAIDSGKFKELPATGGKPATFVKQGPDLGRNDPCHCGSGKKFKKCHGAQA